MKSSAGIWDVIIIGAGPAGCSAALVLARSRRSILLLDDGNQRNIRSRGLHNFITRDGILPTDFLRKAYEELSVYNINVYQTRAQDIVLSEGLFCITDSTERRYRCRRILIATGVKDHIPDIPGMEELWGASVFHCPFCDGFECGELTVGLYSRILNGAGMAMALKHLSAETILFTDGARYLRATQKTRLAKAGIRVITEKISGLIHNGKTLTAVALSDGVQVPCSVLFTNHGMSVNRELLDILGCRCTSKGAAITNRKQQTNITGVYVAGDASIDMHFVVVASAEGVKAAVAIHNDLLQEEHSGKVSADRFL